MRSWAVRIPADGSAHHMIQLDTVDIKSEGNVDSFLSHVPDFREYWGYKEGWKLRDLASYTAKDQSLPELNGVYFGFKSLALDCLPLSKYTGFCGDAFITRTKAWEYQPGEYMERYDEHGRVVYEDIPITFLESSLLKLVLERLHEM